MIREVLVFVGVAAMVSFGTLALYQAWLPWSFVFFGVAAFCGHILYAGAWLIAAAEEKSFNEARKTYREIIDENRRREHLLFAERAELQSQLDAVRKALLGGGVK